MGFGLKQTLFNLPNIDFQETRLILLPKNFLTPGFWVAICAIGSARNYSINNFQFADDAQQGYASAMGISRALTGEDDYDLPRSMAGKNYSPIEKLASSNQTDNATSSINSCLRSLCPEILDRKGFQELQDVVGETHSNVWDHGLDTGFSMAQCSKVPHCNDRYIEFALADKGMGFRREMTRTGHTPDNDRAAIEWCIQEGNSTKISYERDEFAQRVPVDHLGGNQSGPPGELVYSDGSENHHQGLGLAKLISLVMNYNGKLCLVSGSAGLDIAENGRKEYFRLPTEWQGVALSCRFRASHLTSGGTEEDNEATRLARALEGFSNEQIF